MNMDQLVNEKCQGKLKYLEKTFPNVILSTTNPTWPDRQEVDVEGGGGRSVVEVGAGGRRSIWAVAGPGGRSEVEVERPRLKLRWK
jgi:hypothetical protein